MPELHPDGRLGRPVRQRDRQGESWRKTPRSGSAPLRGDNELITIGEDSNVQDGT
jgi:hypothetical protein